MNIIDEISKIGIVPVIALDRAEDAEPLAKALCKGGLNCAEVTFRTAAAEESIHIMSEKFPDMLVGAGTVLTTAQVDQAIGAGARFIVSPGLNPTVVAYCVEKGIPVIPGCANPSDVEVALSYGLNVVKFFPAEAAGGIAMIKAMSAPYSGVRFMPTGGINAANLREYLDFSKIVACGGSWMVSKDLIAAQDFDQIAAKTRQAVDTMLGFEMHHIGINNENDEQAAALAGMFAGAFGFGCRETELSYWAGQGIEVMKNSDNGARGHIGILTADLPRAIYHLEKRGVAFDYQRTMNDEKGQMRLIYLQQEFGGFAIHLMQKKA